MCTSQIVRVERLHRLETVAAAEKLRLIAEVDARQAWRAEGARSTADLLTRRLRLTRSEARAQTDTAVGLERLPTIAAAIRAGEVGIGQAQVAARVAANAPRSSPETKPASAAAHQPPAATSTTCGGGPETRTNRECQLHLAPPRRAS